MNLIIILLSLAIVIPLFTLAGHLYVAYKLAPERAKLGILESLTNDSDFQTSLVISIVNNLMKVQKDGTGKEFIPMDVFISRAKESFQEYFNRTASQMSKEMDETIEQVGMSQNPLLGIALQQIPKKYRGVVMLLMNQYGNQGYS